MLDIPLQGCIIRLSSPSDLAQSYFPAVTYLSDFQPQLTFGRQPISGSLPALEPLTGLAFYCDPPKTFLTTATQLKFSNNCAPAKTFLTTATHLRLS